MWNVGIVEFLYGLTHPFNELPFEEVSIIRDRQMNYQTYLDKRYMAVHPRYGPPFPDDATQLSIAEQRRFMIRCATPLLSNGLAIYVLLTAGRPLVCAITVLAVAMRVLFIFTVVALSWVD